MLSVSCREVGVDCDFVGKGESEKELMDNLVDHAIKDHGFTREDVLKPEMQEKIKAQYPQIINICSLLLTSNHVVILLLLL